VKTAIITGASSGIGKEFVKKICEKEEFERIWVIARNREKLLDLEYTFGEKIVPFSLDLTKSEDLDEFKALLEKEKPDVKLLINNAGFGKFGSHSQIPVNESADMIDLNCKAVVVLSELCIPYVKTNGSLIALKAAKAEEEAAEAEHAITVLGGSSAVLHKKQLILPDSTAEPRCLIEIKKIKPSPAIYPRAYAAILKKPL